MSAYDDTAARAEAERRYPIHGYQISNPAFTEGARWEHNRQSPEVERLRRWKAEALPVIAGLQDLGRALNLRPGTRITGQDALDAVLDLHRQLAAARQPTEAQIDAAAKAIYENTDWSGDPATAWDELRDDDREGYGYLARAVLIAAGGSDGSR